MSPLAFVPFFLLPVDGSAHADGAVRYLARHASRMPGSRVIILHATDGHSSLSPDQAIGGATMLLEQAAVRFEIVQASGSPAQAILECAADRAVSEIVMGSRGLGRWSGLVVGSVAMKVVQHAPVPVTVVGDYAAQPPSSPADRHRILLAVDGSRPALRAAEYVCALQAAGLPLEVELLAVVGPLPPAFVQENITPEKLAFYYRQEGDRLLYEARAMLENAAVPVKRHIEAGFVTDKLIQVAASTACHRLVLGSRSRSGVQAMLLGSTAYQAMHLSTLPVTLVK